MAALHTIDGRPILGFHNRRDAGRQLAAALSGYGGRDDVIVLALPRGGVPVAYEVARALRAPLDVLVVRKLGVPGQEELAMGAIASGGLRVLDAPLIRSLGITAAELERVTSAERRELARRELAYRGRRALPDLRRRTVIVVDDGLATGATMQAAIEALRQQEPAAVVAAAPVAARDTCDRLRGIADDCVCVQTPRPFYGVGAWYDYFAQVGDDEVRALLDAARGTPPLTDARHRVRAPD